MTGQQSAMAVHLCLRQKSAGSHHEVLAPKMQKMECFERETWWNALIGILFPLTVLSLGLSNRRRWREGARSLMSGIERAIATVALLACANCTSSNEGPWQKAGTGGQTVSQDMAQCREAAQDEALRRYPYRAGSPAVGGTGAMLSQQRDDSNRSIAEAALFNDCMESRGYRRTPAVRG